MNKIENDNFLYTHAFDICYENYLHLPKNKKYGIVRGEIGLILCLASFYHITQNEKYKEWMYDELNKVVEKHTDNYTLGYGLTGLFWALGLINKKDLFGVDLRTQIEGVSENEFNLMINKNNLDYFNGALGILFYFICEKETDRSRRIVDLFINKINIKIEANDWMSSYFDEGSTSVKAVNLGTPHGITGILLILLLIKEKGRFVDQEIRKICNLLLDYSFKFPEKSFFPSMVMDDGNKPFSSISWCYGDLMASYSIYKAGLLLDEKYYQELGLNILKKTIDRKDYLKNELCVCHGYVSLSHIYYKIYEMTNDVCFYEASCAWKNRSIQVFEKRIIQFVNNNMHDKYFEDPSLLSGFSGFFLSMLTWNSEIKYDWTKFLLI